MMCEVSPGKWVPIDPSAAKPLPGQATCPGKQKLVYNLGAPMPQTLCEVSPGKWVQDPSSPYNNSGTPPKKCGFGDLGCMAMPGLKQITARLLRGLLAAHAEDVISSILTAFVAGLASIDLERHSIAPRLLWAAKRTAVKTCRQEATCVPVTAETLSMIAPRPVGGHEDLVLADAVRQGVITAEEAELIGVTRLEKIPLSVFARERGEVPRRLYDRRERAEKRLVAAIQEGKVTANSAGLDRNPGW